MISALIQSEAAILAVVITLSLVAVQQASSSYSHRVIEIFKDIKINSDFYILIGIYLIAMIYGSWVLKQINDDASGNLANFQNTILFPSFESHVNLTYILGIFAFIALVPYLLNTLNLLNPFKIIELLSEKITKENICKSIEEGEYEPIKYMYDSGDFDCEMVESYKSGKYINDEINPIQPIIDIIRSSLMRNDYETARKGLKTVGKCTNNAFENIDGRYIERLINPLIKQYKGLGDLAIKNNDEDSTMQIIINLRENAIMASAKHCGNTTSLASDLIRKIGLQMSKENSKIIPMCVSYSLGKIENTKKTIAENKKKIV